MTAQIHTLDLEREDRIAVAVLSGEIDMSNATAVRHGIAEYVTQDDDAVIIDLSALAFIDSAGLHAVYGLSAVLEEKRQRLLLIVPHGSQVERTLEVIGMPSTISVHLDRASAMEAARAASNDSVPGASDGEV